VEANEGFLYGGIQSRGTMAFDILGDAFLRCIYAVSSAAFRAYLKPALMMLCGRSSTSETSVSAPYPEIET
jgi:hypothetical protein